MMRKFLLLLLILGILVSVTSAEENYQLYPIDAEAYMEAMPPVMAQVIQTGGLDTLYYSYVSRNIIQEFDLRYGNTNLARLPFSLMLDFHTSLLIGTHQFTGVDERDWFLALLEAGLRDSQITVASGEFSVGTFDIESIPLNIRDSNTADYLLSVVDRLSGRKFYALAGEMLWDLPLPITGLPANAVIGQLRQTSELTILDIRDVTGDGKDEIIVEGGGYGVWAFCGDLYVISWQNNTAVDLTGDLFHYCYPIAQQNYAAAVFVTTQPDVIRMVERRIDGWNCKRVHTHTLNLIDLNLSEDTFYDTSPWCDLKTVATAFNTGDYVLAADIYRNILHLFDGQMHQYIVARLVLAQALAGDLEQARTSLFDIVVPEGQMGELLLRLQAVLEAVGDQPEEMCQQVYGFFLRENQTREDPSQNPYDWTPDDFYFGRERDDPRYFPLPSPIEAGCSAAQVPRRALPSPNPMNNMPDLGSFLNAGAYLMLKEARYQDALDTIEFFLAEENEQSLEYRQTLLYWRALTFELMGEVDAALAGYVTTYEFDPDSAWGQLSALHSMRRVQ